MTAQIRNEDIPAHRGLITDQKWRASGDSTPVTTLIANPQRIAKAPTADDIARLARLNIPWRN